MTTSHPLVVRLRQLAARNERAALAELRRSLADPIAAMPSVAPFFGKETRRHEEDALILVAGLFALHPSPGTRSLAAALRTCAQSSDSVALRFQALLDCDADDLPTHLRHAVSLVRSADLAIDYDDLLLTIRWWRAEERDRQRRWARDFWGATDLKDNEEASK